MSHRHRSLALPWLMSFAAGLGASAEADIGTPGSLLLFPEVDTTSGNRSLITVTNTDLNNAVLTRWFYIDGANCQESNRTQLLAPGDTRTVIANLDIAEQIRGYLYVVALDPTTEAPIVFNSLVGESSMLDGLKIFDYRIQPFVFSGIGDGVITDLNGDGRQDLNGVEYSPVADEIVIPRFFGQSSPPGGMIESEIVLIDLTGGRDSVTEVLFLSHNDDSAIFSDTTSFTCWTKRRLVDVSFSFLASSLQSFGDDPGEVIGAPNLESGWTRVNGLATTDQDGNKTLDPAVLGFLVERVQGQRSAEPPFTMGQQDNGGLGGGGGGLDCNMNGIPDAQEIASGALDCDADGLLDECEDDCNMNTVPDDCETAGSISFSMSVSLMTTDWNDTLTFPRFDPALGNLVSVDFTLAAFQEGSVQIENMGNEPTPVAAIFSSVVGLKRPDNTLILSTAPENQFMQRLSAFDGVLDFAGSSGVISPLLNSTQVSTATSPRPASDLALFSGPVGNPGIITLPLCATGFSSVQGGANLTSVFTLSAGASAIVRYNFAVDCNMNGIPDECEIPPDCNMNGIPDECEVPPDCNQNGIPDECEIPPDCNQNGIPDECEIPPDCNQNGVPDECELPPDCNDNGIPDTCEADADMNGIPDECEPPDCPGGVTLELWPPDHEYHAVDLDGVAGVVDPGGNPVSIVITAITQDEPINGPGDGNTVCDGNGVGTSVAQIRAERQGGGNGRVYVISYTATNAFGASCSGSVEVTVPHSQNGQAAIDDGQTQDSTEGC